MVGPDGSASTADAGWLDGQRRRAAAGLPAGRAMRRPARIAGLPLPTMVSAACRTGHRRRRAPQEQTKCRIVRPRLGARRQHFRIDSPKHRPAHRIHHGDHDLGAARRIEHDPISLRADTSDLYQFTRASHLSQPAYGIKHTRLSSPPTARPRRGRSETPNAVCSGGARQVALAAHSRSRIA